MIPDDCREDGYGWGWGGRAAEPRDAAPRRRRWMTDAQWNGMPSRLPDEPMEKWRDRQHAYVERLRAERRAARAEARRREVAAAAAAGLPPPARPWLRRHERFCQRFVALGNAADAARAAGYAYASAGNQGYRLLKRPEIQARIAAIHRELAAAFGLDARVLLGKLETVYRRAIEHKDLSAAARVVELQARIAGLAASRGRPTAAAAAPADDDK